MSLQFRVHTSQESRSSLSGASRVLVRASKPPESPLTKSNTCDAIDPDNQPCKFVLPSNGQTWCRAHLKELKDVNARWRTSYKYAERVEVVDPDTAKQKVLHLRSAIDLRRLVRERFYSRGGDTTDFITWIMRLEKDLGSLADSILMSSIERGATPVTPAGSTSHPDKAGSERIMIFQSPLDPRIPIQSLTRMPNDGTILVLKHFYTDLCTEGVRRLYSIVPDLNDSVEREDSQMKRQFSHDSGTNIVRTWFRIMIFNDSESEALQHATRSSSISEFLSGCRASQLEIYCDFFDKAWRPQALQYLRAAICAQTLAGGHIKTIQLLGGMIPTTTQGLKMTKPCWDVLYRWFPTLLVPWTVASICSNFEDYTIICKLLMLGIYREHWYNPDSILAECPTAVYLGFIPSNKGDFSSAAGLKQELDGNAVVQEESRNYVCGKMAIGNPLAKDFLDELRRRTERLILVVYESTNADATVHPSEAELFISRRRSAKSHEDIERVEWTTAITLEDVKNDLRMQKTSTYDPIVVDSWEFILIDKDPGLPFQLFDIIQDTLLLLANDPSPRQIAKRVIRDVIPPSVQEIFFKGLSIESSPEIRFPAPPEVQYEGNRQRCYNPDRKVILKHQTKMDSETRSRDENRLIRRVVDDMEHCGIITLATEYECPQTRPLIIQGSDGGLDLYFPYEFGGLSPDSELTPSLTLPPSSCLLDFASNFMKKNPGAIMAKGSILTHYCAWPMPAIKRLGKSRLNFGTWEGHVYHWNAMRESLSSQHSLSLTVSVEQAQTSLWRRRHHLFFANRSLDLLAFDRPWSERAWQFYMQHYINSKYPFVMFYLTTFVICAVDKEDAEKKTAMILEEMEKREWRIVMPSLRDWTEKIADLRLGEMFNGVRPV
ncbi:hypothetical protein K505DRAFT_421768 [Melanomma pulvis-pyrius CBS 109.77]|uniref:Uncharacterized protein n=1 Tax=Melanomma pulvis-pyrius CBS 109.77 TaxID=1314802 RepID=A0A6A6WTP2_9PLEO|nr:hypothetical protein K505DRAFT_421768 [Melanomma pulvis-pyrius CBS 109.77]